MNDVCIWSLLERYGTQMGKTEANEEQPFSALLCPQHITCGLRWDRRPASVVTGVEGGRRSLLNVTAYVLNDKKSYRRDRKLYEWGQLLQTG